MGRNGSSLHGLLVSEGIPDRGARVYLAACREGPQTASELARLSQLNRVDAYRFIRQLVEAGLLQATSGRPMRFAAVPPDQLIDRFIHQASEKARELESIRDRILLAWRNGASEPGGLDDRRFAVLEGPAVTYRFLKRKVGAAQKEILACGTRESLTRALDHGLDRSLREAEARGVKIRLMAHIEPAMLPLLKQFESFAAVRHSPVPFGVPSLLVDHSGMFVNISDHYANGSSAEPMVGLWATCAELIHSGRAYFRHIWTQSSTFAARQVALETPSTATINVVAGRDDDSLLRLKEVAEMGMRAAGIQELHLDLVELIGSIGRQLGRDIADRLEGEGPQEVVRAIASYYATHGMGQVAVVKDRPLTLKITGCFSTSPPNEVGRILCPAILGAALERRLGARWAISPSEPGRSHRGGCLFTLVPP